MLVVVHQCLVARLKSKEHFQGIGEYLCTIIYMHVTEPYINQTYIYIYIYIYIYMLHCAVYVFMEHLKLVVLYSKRYVVIRYSS